MDTVTARDLRNNTAAVLGRVGRGETLTVTRVGQLVAADSLRCSGGAGCRVLIAQHSPKLAGEVRAVLLREGYLDLAEQVDSLEMRAMCDCGDDFCQTIYCVPPPKGVLGARLSQS